MAVSKTSKAATPKVLYLAPELAPWMKSGGLGDVARALPETLRAGRTDVRVLIPGYSPLLAAFPDAKCVAELPKPNGVFAATRLLEAKTETGLTLYLIDCPEYYVRAGTAYLDPNGDDFSDNALRFGLLSYIGALIASTDNPLSWQPNVLHANDWPGALAPVYLKNGLSSQAKTVFTVHNLAFQGLFPPATLATLGLPAELFNSDGLEFWGMMSFLKGGLVWADHLVSVSPRYAEEIQTSEYGCGMDGLLRSRSTHLTGVLNGIDEAAWNPATDTHLPTRYSAARLGSKAKNKEALQARLGLTPDASIPLMGVISRLTHQKGLDLLAEIAPALTELPAQIVVLGRGERHLETAFRELAQRYPTQIAAVIDFDEALAHQIEAGADMFLMPSRFEPCGLNQMYSLRYGTPPVVRNTGGLADTVVDATEANLAENTANGFMFEEASAQALMATIERAVSLYRKPKAWRALQKTGMAQELGWKTAAASYRALYKDLLTK